MFLKETKADTTMNPQEFVNYTSFINQTCKELFRITGVNHFSYVEMNDNGQFFWLGSDGKYLEECIDSQLVNTAPLSILKTYPKTGFYIIDVYQEEYKQHSLPVFQMLNRFDYGHSFRILKVDENQTVKLFSFDAPIEKNDINHMYLNNLETFKKFNNYFEDRITFIREDLQKSHILETQLSEFIDLFNVSLKQKDLVNQALSTDFYPSETKIQLTPREKEILFWYIRGKTSDETAKLLNISRRTIERHFENLRDKFGCYSKNQIALKVMNLFDTNAWV
ncbi:helix-turn-helix transcriptional regulator [Legionella brunensis]|uniref:Response regulator containing a CheY-like receiver domain and an HTH DNA-binding domain protein n=1 Tax=Legionella brunensis TaxID=29422 RepID=A0A0W0STX6_9GAMM|nr:helix-turn-helix domain-containing protein [Legionella brunensis]KTC86814.1 Response regulator containing a CheY-like receiver domain and an HTH DNA-binding domain protein [Legionella brunensis]